MNVIIKSLETNVADMLKYDKGNAVEHIVKIVFEALLQAERGHFLKENPEQNKANGYYSRLIRSVNNYFRLNVPRDRLSLFKPALLELSNKGMSECRILHISCTSRALQLEKSALYLKKRLEKKMSPGAVSHITKEFEEQRITWQKRPLEESYYFVYIDCEALLLSIQAVTCLKGCSNHLFISGKKSVTLLPIDRDYDRLGLIKGKKEVVFRY